MSNFWKPTIPLVRDSEEVRASIVNRATQAQGAREDFLYRSIQELSLTSGRVVKALVPITDETEVNDIVYFDAGLGKYAPALAEVTYEDGEPRASARSFAVGMALSASGGFGNVLLLGHILIEGQEGQYTINPLSMLDVAEASFTEGVYYLSRRAPGKISSVPSAPCVQLGSFSTSNINFLPTSRGLQDGHFHYSFDLYARPSASQNYLRTGWTVFAGDGAERKFVDYFNRGTETDPPAIIASIRWTGAAEPSLQRVEIFRSSATEFSISLHSGDDLDYDDPESVAADITTIAAATWPDYGTYIAVGDTGLEVAFLRWDEDYTNTLTVDAAALLTLTTDKFIFFLPNDLKGWTNANSFDLDTPTAITYRYVTEGQKPLARAFPPLPLESARLENAGVGLIPGIDFEVTLGGIYWIPSGDAAPWPTDFIADGSTEDPANARNIRLSFTKVTASNHNSQVLSLKSLSPAIVVKSCPDGEDASTGHLSIDLDLGLTVDDTVTEGRDLALVGIDKEKFLVGPVVSELLAGPGILLERVSTSQLEGSRFTGQVRVSRKDVNLGGEVSSIALRNAKEVFKENFAYVSFPPPSLVSSAIVARFTIPQAGLTAGEFDISLAVNALGDTASAVLTNAVFKVTFHAVRAGLSLVDLTDEKAMAIHYWRVPFGPSYAAFSVLEDEMPVADVATPDQYLLTLDSMQSLSTIKLAGGLQDGDLVSVTIRRVTADEDDVPDNYDGDVGFAGLRWDLTT